MSFHIGTSVPCPVFLREDQPGFGPIWELKMSEVSMLMVHVRSNPALYLALLDLSAAKRTEYLQNLIQQMFRILDGLPSNDEQLAKHLDLLFMAVEEQCETAATSIGSCARIAIRIYQQTSWPIDLVKTVESLVARIVSCIVVSEDSNEAKGCLQELASFYISTPYSAVQEIIRRELGRARDTCTVKRLAECIVTLYEMRSWNYGEKETIFDTLAIGLLRKQLTSNPDTVDRAARMELIIGDTFSDVANRKSLRLVEQIKRIDETAASFLAHMPEGGWKLVDIDHVGSEVHLVAEGAPIFDHERCLKRVHDQTYNWTNPHHGKVRVHLDVRIGGEIVNTTYVDGIASNVTVGR